jgi:hypothetical protein
MSANDGASLTPASPRARRRAPQRAAASEPIVERIGPAISKVAWSPELVAQSLEILPVFGDKRGLTWLKPIHAASLRIGLPPIAKPGDVVVQTLGWYELTPRVVHSTSWRLEDARVILTYVAVVADVLKLPPDSLVGVSVRRLDLARGDALAPPPAIGTEQVVEHALRHLSWLLQDDPAIRAALPDWLERLKEYEPEPFRALG